MTHFLGTHQNRLDAKGRVSVPAPFRAALEEPWRRPMATARISCCARPISIRASRPGRRRMFDALAEPLNRCNLFSHEHDDLAASLYADAFPVEADKEGRICCRTASSPMPG